jgi:hypothetical protein
MIADAFGLFQREVIRRQGIEAKYIKAKDKY